MSTSLLIVLHLIGVIMIFTALGGALVRAGAAPDSSACRRSIMAFHGIGALVVIIAGTMLLVRLGSGFSGWVWVKIVIWLVLGAVPALLKRKPSSAGVLWWLVVVLGASAAFLGIFKPF